MCIKTGLYIATPIAVPRVLVIRSLIPELRVGRKYCVISISRLTARPIATTVILGRRIGRTSEKYAVKKNPSGTNPAIFTQTPDQ
jgi:hypothetical protein